MKMIRAEVVLNFDLEDDIEFSEEVVESQIEMVNHILSEMISWSQPQIKLPSKGEGRKISVMEFK